MFACSILLKIEVNNLKTSNILFFGPNWNCRIQEIHFNELEKRLCHLSAVRRGKGHKNSVCVLVREKSGNFVADCGWPPRILSLPKHTLEYFFLSV